MTAATQLELETRLYAAGLPRAIDIIPHANRTVLVSLTGRGALRVHRGYAIAPDEVVAAIALWAQPRMPRPERRKAQRLLIAFPVHAHVPPVRARRRPVDPPRPGDQRILARLAELFAELNARHFGGALGRVTLRLSARMRRRLGEFRPADSTGAPAEIRISRRHLRRDGWRQVRETLAHEMVHQWQAETGRRLAHDAEFRGQCAGMGIDRRAVRRLDDDLTFPAR